MRIGLQSLSFIQFAVLPTFYCGLLTQAVFNYPYNRVSMYSTADLLSGGFFNLKLFVNLYQ